MFPRLAPPGAQAGDEPVQNAREESREDGMALELPVMPAGVNGRHEALVRRSPVPSPQLAVQR